jgi:hypothetical protein
MYERRYGTDWTLDDVGPDEAVRRLYALGVASAVGAAPTGERERLLGLVERRYHRSMLELAHEEGRTEARELRRGTDAATDPETVWERLVAGDEASPGATVGAAVRASDLPDAVAPPGLLDARPDDGRSRLDPPEALRRD